MNDFELHAHLIGKDDSRRRLNTPCLLIDLPALDRNIARMADLAKARGLKLRPHAKTHKSVDIARRQLAAGAVGICCAKLGEAEALADGGITSLLITSPVVSTPGVQRLMALRAQVAELMVVVDHPENVAALGSAAEAAGVKLQVLIDIDPGSKRTGVASAEQATALAAQIRAQRSLEYVGVQFYCGPQQHINAYADRQRAVAARFDYLRTVIAALTAQGAAPSIITGGGTGTHQIDAALGVLTELQVGSYIFMDNQYRACEFADSEAIAPFEQALFVDARVVSVNAKGRVTIDAGLKAFATEAGPPGIYSGAPTGSEYIFMGDEHGCVILPEDAEPPRLNDVITLTPPHCDPTVNLYDTFHVVRGDRLEALWPVSGRGRSR